MVGVRKKIQVDERRKVNELFARRAEFFQAVSIACETPITQAAFLKQGRIFGRNTAPTSGD